MHSPACLIRAADVGAALLAKKGMNGAEFDKRMRERFGTEYMNNREAIFKASYGQYLEARSATKAAGYARREGAYVEGRAGGELGQGKLGEGYLSPQQIAKYKADFARTVTERAAAGKKATRARVELAQQYAALEKTGAVGVLRAARKSGFTFGVFVQLRNLGSNTVNVVTEGLLTKPISAAVDMFVAADTRQRTTAPSDLRLFAKSGYEGAHDGIQEAWHTLWNGATPAQLERLQLPTRTNSGYKYLDAWLGLSPRISSAADALFRGYAAKRSLASRARAMALTEAKAGKIKPGEVGRRTGELYNAPTPDMEMGAIADAEFLTFNNENKLSASIENAKRSGGQGVALAVEVPMPYTRVPTNIGLRFLDYLGGGLIRAGTTGSNYLQLKVGTATLAPFDLAGIKVARAKRGEFQELMKTAFGADEATRTENQRKFAAMFSRGLVGPGLAALGAYLASQGMTPGYYSKSDTGERKRDEAGGVSEGSFIINGRSYDARWAGPAINVMLFGATLYHAYQDRAEGFGGRAKKLLGAGKELLVQQTALLENAQQFSDLVDHPERWAAYLSDTAQSYVPGLNAAVLRDVANMSDTSERQAEPVDMSTVGSTLESGTTSFVDAIARDIPGVRTRLPEARDAFGQPKQHNRFDQLFRSKDVSADPYIAELGRLDMDAPRIVQEKGESPRAFLDRSSEIGARRLEAGRLVVGSEGYRRLAALPGGEDLQRAVLTDAAARAKDEPLGSDTERAAFVHNADVEGRKRAAVESRLKADPRFGQLDKKGQAKAVELLGGVYGDAKYTPKSGEDPTLTETRLAKAAERLKKLADDGTIGTEIDRIVKTIGRAKGSL